MIRWSDALASCQRSDVAHVLVTVIGTQGSVPRNSGTKMLVTATDLHDTLGGGNLELHAIEQARQLLTHRVTGQRVVKYPLAAGLGQCCGGHATLLFESFCHSTQILWLFGAGHVGNALVQILQELPLNIHWVDTRSDQFPIHTPQDIHRHCPDNPAQVFSQINQDSILLIMTHSHDQDYAICEQALAQQHQGMIGLIGSRTKAARFRHRLKRAGFSSAEIQRIESPVGLLEIGGKRPMEVAVSIAGRVIQFYQAAQATADQHQELSLAELNDLASSITPPIVKRIPNDAN